MSHHYQLLPTHGALNNRLRLLLPDIVTFTHQQPTTHITPMIPTYYKPPTPLIHIHIPIHTPTPPPQPKTMIPPSPSNLERQRSPLRANDTTH